MVARMAVIMTVITAMMTEFPKYRKSEKRFVFPRLAFLKWMGVSVDD